MNLSACQAYAASLSTLFHDRSSFASCGSSSSAINLYKKAVQLFHVGALEEARGIAEQVLERCAVETFPDSWAPSSNGEPSCSIGIHSSADPSAFQNQLATFPLSLHLLFTDTLLLLANIYSAGGIFTEAKRLLATCVGYVRDSFRSWPGCDSASPSKGTKPSNVTRIIPSSSNKEEKVLIQLQKMAFATISYNRAVLAVEEYLSSTQNGLSQEPRHRPESSCSGAINCTSNSIPQEDAERRTFLSQKANTNSLSPNCFPSELPSLLEKVKEARNVFLEDTIQNLQDCLEGGRHLLADAWHTRGVCQLLLGQHVNALLDFQKSVELRSCFLSKKREGSSGFTIPSTGIQNEKIIGSVIEGHDRHNRTDSNIGEHGGCPGAACSHIKEEAASALTASIALKLALTLEHVVQLYRSLDRPCSSFLFFSIASSSSALSMNMNWMQDVLHWITCTRRDFFLLYQTRNTAHQSMHPMVRRALFLEGVFAAEHGRHQLAKECFEECLYGFANGSELKNKKNDFKDGTKEKVAINRITFPSDRMNAPRDRSWKLIAPASTGEEERLDEVAALFRIPSLEPFFGTRMVPFPTPSEVLKWVECLSEGRAIAH